MKSIANIVNLKLNVFMASINSNYSCFSVSIHFEHQLCLKFYFLTNCINYQFICMSNGYGLLVHDHEICYKVNKVSQNCYFQIRYLQVML